MQYTKKIDMGFDKNNLLIIDGKQLYFDKFYKTNASRAELMETAERFYNKLTLFKNEIKEQLNKNVKLIYIYAKKLEDNKEFDDIKIPIINIKDNLDEFIKVFNLV